ncbi:DUF2797 domain-containing protein [Endozoicomonas euniceicola]|uniref:DUF2797 domain-containing protein n=1 Tax=Endozoicomonas euniceicola TaxID=1234143 RepID=A0ABY6GVD7_9GAMM|nr:DUF2797 domain-containing protein [Endozoicomonas euniceicola]UYM16733.1 DUF2797 domain-containing protein [Endozoicomonas euniceicola]
MDLRESPIVAEKVIETNQAMAGNLRKMVSELQGTVVYQLPVGDDLITMNDLIGRKIVLDYQGEINCCHCGRKTKKSFSQGYCYPCFKKLPQCDICIMSPEKCHYHQGTCRDARWGEQFCMTDHVVYLANSSGLKVGITRASQMPTRWIDQGATQAMAFMRVATRQQSGLLESLFKEFVADRTNWRTMLKGSAEPLDLATSARELMDMNRSRITALQEQFGIQAIQPVAAPTMIDILYPVEHYPSKISSLSFDKTPTIEGVLQGIKGQYLILDTGVLNIRKHTSYKVSFTHCA